MNTEDLNFAYKVRHVLNEKIDQLPPSTTDRLASARKAAIACKKAGSPVRVLAPALAGTGRGFFSAQLSWMTRVGVAVPLLAAVIGLVGIYNYERQQRIAEIAELDAAVLSDELPVTAYLDHGFNAYLAQDAQGARRVQ